MNRRQAWLAGGACVAIAAVAGWFRPTMLATNAVGPHDAAWRLPTAADLERSSAAQFAAASGVSWVGSGPAGGAPVAEWTLLGLVGRADDRAVLVRAGNDPLIKRVGAGDTLPDGSRLVSVGTNGILIDRDGCRMRRPLYPAPDQDKTSGQCLPAGNDRGQ